VSRSALSRTARPGSPTCHPLPVATAPETRTHRPERDGLALLAAIVALMWIIEVINTADHNQLNMDGLYPRNFEHLWGIFTAPFLHASFAHLFDNTIPLVFMGVIIALRGAVRLALVTLIVIVVGGLGTWLISPSGPVTVGASGVVFGYATYLLARGIFNRSLLELLMGAVVGIVFGGALLASLVPHYGISWQGHACGAVGGVVAAWWLAARDSGAQARAKRATGGVPARALAK
jgi:membrane associated rhomboid family serine protease